jgi:hypothetical protein
MSGSSLWRGVKVRGKYRESFIIAVFAPGSKLLRPSRALIEAIMLFSSMDELYKHH